MSAHGNSEQWWLENWWQVIVIALGIILVLIFALYGPTTS